MRELVDQVVIRAPHADIWDALEDFGGVSKWAPSMKRSKLVGSLETGVGTRRIMHHRLGFNFEEQVTEWIDGVGYEFEVYRAPYPMTKVRENWRLDNSNGECIVSSHVTYQMHLGVLGRWLDAGIVHHIVRHEMRSGLQGLKDFVEQAAATQPVPVAEQ